MSDNVNKKAQKKSRKNASAESPVRSREEANGDTGDTAGPGEPTRDETPETGAEDRAPDPDAVLEAGNTSKQEPGASDSDEGAAPTTQDLIEKLTREKDDFLERLKRERADFLNHKKWVEKERREWESASICRFVQELLPFIDDMDRAMKATGEASDVEALRKGFEMICSRFQEALKAGGVEEIPSDGEPFDPKVHEAILQVEDLDHPAGTILETTHRGFQISGRLIRPAKVVVSQAPQSSPTDAENDRNGQDKNDNVNERDEETEDIE